MKQTEHEIQCEVVEFCRLNKEYPDLKMIYAIPNGGKRGKKLAGELKMEGVKAGIPDLCLPIAKDGYFGLYLEMKKPGGVTSDSQIEVMGNLKRLGYKTVVCYSSEEAIDILYTYIVGEDTAVYYKRVFSERENCA